MAAQRQIALLRGVNLGSVRKISMGELRERLTERGYGDPRTLVNSGNVVLTSGSKPRRLERELEEVLTADLGVETRVLVRTRDELAEVVSRNPLSEEAERGKGLHVSFLSEEPTKDAVRALEQADVAPERIAVRGREIYLWLPGGMQRSKAVRLVSDDRLGVASTRRTWNVVTQLLAIADE